MKSPFSWLSARTCAHRKGIALCALLAAAPISCRDTGTSGGGAQDGPRVDLPRYRVDLFDDDHALGGDHPLVTVVFFSDYACPPCRSMWSLMRNLVEDYGEDLRVVWRSYTVPGFGMGERAADAALAAARQGKFWPMHWRLYEAIGEFDRPTIRAHAEALGLDVPKFMDDFDSGVGAPVRLRHKRQAVKLGVRAVPILFVNGLPMVGANLDEAAWHGLLDAEIARARRRMAEGVRRDELYAEILRNATVGPIPAVPEAEALRDELKASATSGSNPRAERPAAVEGRRYDVGPGTMPLRGPSDAPVQVVAFIDFQCPFCRRAHAEAVTKILREHPKDVAYTVRHLPLEIHPRALAAAKAAVAFARQGKFWWFHDKVLAYEGPLNRDRFVDWARQAGLDEAIFLRDLSAPETTAVVRADMEAARALGIPSTPAFFVNGTYVRGYTPGVLEATVRSELEKARAEIRKGVPRAEVAALIRSRGEKPATTNSNEPAHP